MTDHPITPPPPVGLRPRWLADEQRLNEVDAALERYRQAGIEPPEEWLNERRDIEDRLLRHHPCAAALAQPEPQGPTDQEIEEWADAAAEVPLEEMDPEVHGWRRCFKSDEFSETIRAALRRWGSPAIEPEPQGPSDQELLDVFWEHQNGLEELWADDWPAAARAVLARWGRRAGGW